jgi:hypothetical protein
MRGFIILFINELRIQNKSNLMVHLNKIKNI